MKRNLIILVLAILAGCSAKVVNFDQLQDRNGIYFLANDEKPFTGEVVAYVNGKLEFEGQIKNGLREGVWTFYYPNGQKKIEGLFTDGLKEGSWTFWKENGIQEYVELYKLGKQLGNTPMQTGDSLKSDTASNPPPAPAVKQQRAAKKSGSSVIQEEREQTRKPSPVIWERLRGGSVKFLDNIPYTGPVIKYFRNGSKELEGQFTNGHRDGKWLFYDKYGNIKDVRYY